ncbi:MAG: hypothetical protein AB7G11_07100 [Phycisphaerales bacterium]
MSTSGKHPGPLIAREGAAASLRRRVLVFFVMAGGVYLGLVLLWQVDAVARGYGSAYRAVARACLSDFGSRGDLVEFLPNATQPGMDTAIVANRRGVPVAGRTYHSTHVIGYLATAELLALIVATPVSWRRRAIALALGLGAIHVFIGLRVVLIIIWLYSTPGALYARWQFSSGARDALEWAVEMFASSLNATFFVPVAIWALLMFRADELRSLRPGPSASRGVTRPRIVVPGADKSVAEPASGRR